MNESDVLSDAVKIGLPLLLTGIFAILAARGSRRHDLSKEILRRRQDFLEQAVVDIDNFTDRVMEAVLSAATAADLKKSGHAAHVRAAELALLELEKATAAEAKVSLLQSKLVLFRLGDQIGSDLNGLVLSLLELRTNVTRIMDGAVEHSATDPMRADVWEKRHALTQLFADEFEKLPPRASVFARLRNWRLLRHAAES